MNVNVWDVTYAVQALVRSRRPVNRSRLVNLDVPLDEVTDDAANDVAAAAAAAAAARS